RAAARREIARSTVPCGRIAGADEEPGAPPRGAAHRRLRRPRPLDRRTGRARARGSRRPRARSFAPAGAEISPRIRGRTALAGPRGGVELMVRAAAFICAAAAIFQNAQAGESAAIYDASWAGLPAGEIRLTLRDDAAAYKDEIVIKSAGLARLLTRFRGSAISEGHFAAEHLPAPS